MNDRKPTLAHLNQADIATCWNLSQRTLER